ncbi:SpoIIE family protein phosphatase [Streptomyces sp. ISL-66]|uniref:ATP-binding SpoIIE family protein phosphatase n=1 Tax=Streptomyces sp. ISL-66 TaxID=2819186 RepID=UPI001BEB4DCD|nr:SpoIIE family protein phosphatase [Streptomyces sp. ISL-66]MBT2469815.1 SpoIIE family protein phosphatase [Streptomyces sp. ISL-66]
MLYVPAAGASGRALHLACTLALMASHGSGDLASADGQWLVLLAPVEGTSTTPELDGEQRRQELSHAAAATIGASLDVTDTVQTLVNLLVPGFADLATVDLAESVLVGDEPARFAASGDVRLRRIAAAQSPAVSAENLLPVGQALPPVPDNALMRPLMQGHPVLISDVATLHTALSVDPEHLRSFIPRGAHSSVAVPLYARGLILGCVTVWRSQLSSAFGDEDASLLEDVVSRTALGVDNARRYTKEHRSALALQRSLLPHSAVDLAAAETAGLYQPAGGGVGVGGDWFDVIPLPSLRVAFVVGDVVGHGLDATAAMARLRTAVQTLADLDLDPGELLTHLDDLVLGLSTEHRTGVSSSELAVLGATCLYAVYDPTTGRLTASTAGHPPPAVLPSQGQPFFLEMAPGPLLGVGGMPFEVAELEIPPGSTLAFFTDGLVESRDNDIEEGMARLRDCLAATAPGLTLDETSQRIFVALLPEAPTDDVALLLARTRRLPPDRIATWEIEADLSKVAHAREVVLRQLSDWNLDDLAFVTELVVSELVTNAIRYAGGPVGLRLIRSEVLVCEVSDPSSTQPRLRRARETDEGGRGLFLVAQLADRWGSRFTGTGKTIWTEQDIGGALS